MGSEDLIMHFEEKRGEIARNRDTRRDDAFGRRRPLLEAPPVCTSLRNSENNPYAYALGRALSIQCQKSYKNILGAHGRRYLDYIVPETKFCQEQRPYFRFGIVKGFIGDIEVPLTQTIILSLKKQYPNPSDRRGGAEFGWSRTNYIGENEESAIWVHTDPEKIDIVMPHIQNLVERAVQGDLTVIPKIHWWYVHLAPTTRGPGGTAEILINTLCQLNEIELPG